MHLSSLLLLQLKPHHSRQLDGQLVHVVTPYNEPLAGLVVDSGNMSRSHGHAVAEPADLLEYDVK